jgi:hypothetical protein
MNNKKEAHTLMSLISQTAKHKQSATSYLPEREKRIREGKTGKSCLWCLLSGAVLEKATSVCELFQRFAIFLHLPPLARASELRNFRSK